MVIIIITKHTAQQTPMYIRISMYIGGIYKCLDMPIAYMDVGLCGILNVSTKPIVVKWGWRGGGIKKQTPSLVVKQTLAISIFHRRPEWSLSLLTTPEKSSGAADGSTVRLQSGQNLTFQRLV